MGYNCLFHLVLSALIVHEHFIVFCTLPDILNSSGTSCIFAILLDVLLYSLRGVDWSDILFHTLFASADHYASSSTMLVPTVNHTLSVISGGVPCMFCNTSELPPVVPSLSLILLCISAPLRIQSTTNMTCYFIFFTGLLLPQSLLGLGCNPVLGGQKSHVFWQMSVHHWFFKTNFMQTIVQFVQQRTKNMCNLWSL